MTDPNNIDIKIYEIKDYKTLLKFLADPEYGNEELRELVKASVKETKDGKVIMEIGTENRLKISDVLGDYLSAKGFDKGVYEPNWLGLEIENAIDLLMPLY